MFLDCVCVTLQVPDYLRRFQGGDLSDFSDAWNQASERRTPQPPIMHPNQEGALFSEFEGIYGQQAGPTGAPHLLDGLYLDLSVFNVLSQLVQGCLVRHVNDSHENVVCYGFLRCHLIMLSSTMSNWSL